MSKSNGPNGAGDELRLLVERAQRIRVEIKEAKEDESDVYKEAKSRGFDSKVLKKVVAYLEKDPEKRREESAIMELYLSTLGHGDGSLSDMARSFVEERRNGGRKEDDGQLDAFTPPPEAGKGPVDPSFGDDLSDKPITVLEAKEMGAAAAKEGKLVTANPFPAGDERRAAWDEAWCGALGSDGMEIPPELQPKKKEPKPKKGGGDDEGEGNDE